jgi:sterol desaturase/sphingolipid hydroxylase (fatty acid hydroxylase superfamily)
VLRRALFPNRIWRTASGRTDLAFFVGGVLFSGVMIGWALLSAEAVRHWAGAAIGIGASPLPGWARAAIATPVLFLAYELAYWLDHWLMHRVPLLWRFHKVHHQAESLSLFTDARVHPVETIGFYNLVALLTGIAAALLDRLIGPGDALTIGGANALVLLSQLCITHLQHSHLWVGFGPRWGRWLLGPAHHQIHHSADPAHFNRNLGASLAVFDRLFGTLHLPATAREKLRFGVEDGTANPHGLRAALLDPFIGAAGIAAGPPDLRRQATR